MRSARRPCAPARGLSLIELMVALALGLLVVGAVLVSSSGMVLASRQQRAASAMTDDAMLALSLIRRDLLMAGYVHPLSLHGDQFSAANSQVSSQPVFGCGTGFADPAAGLGQGACNPAGTSGSDAIEINFEATRDSVERSADDGLTDCQGTRLPDANGNLQGPAGADTRGATVHRYFVVAPAPGQVGDLSCASAVSARQPLVPHVQALQLRYGVSGGWQLAQADTRRPQRYVEAAAVSNWADVVAVQLCVLMRSEQPVLDGQEAATLRYVDCEGQPQQATDRYLRRAYATTVALRNRVAP